MKSDVDRVDVAQWLYMSGVGNAEQVLLDKRVAGHPRAFLELFEEHQAPTIPNFYNLMNI